MINKLTVFTVVATLIISCAPDKPTVEATSTVEEKFNKVEVPESPTLINLKCVLTIRNIIRSGNREKISQLFQYPIKRNHPLKPINNADEMMKRFDEIFDQQFIDQITNQSILQWDAIGWRGVCYGSGDLWLHGLDGIAQDGGSAFPKSDEAMKGYGLTAGFTLPIEKLKQYNGLITNVNYHSKWETSKIKHNIEKLKKRLHLSIQVFKENILEWVTPDYHIRVDKLVDGSYRYASWKVGATQGTKPDLIIQKGNSLSTGSMYSNCFKFRNGSFTYIVDHPRAKTDDRFLIVYKGELKNNEYERDLYATESNSVILKQKVTKIVYDIFK